jgi:hypothetical protein
MLPKDPPHYTPEERSYYDGLLASASERNPIVVSVEMHRALRQYAEWKYDKRPITENTTLDPL